MCRLLIGSVPMSGHISRDNIVVVETRRRWTDGERRQAVEETRHLPVSAVARKLTAKLGSIQDYTRFGFWLA